jgi:ligand-binding sensor domain-containing protein
LRNLLNIYRLLFCLIAIYYSRYSHAQQPENYSYQYYNTNHGLPSPEILCLAKDAKGFLWIGTASGLSMYDGYSFQNHAYSNKSELIGRVNVLKPDGKHLWIGSGAGLFCYANNEIVKISAATTLPQGVNDIFPEGNGTVWLATENGPVKLDPGKIDLTGNKKIILPDHLLPQWNLKNEIIERRRATHISKAPDNTIYISQPHNLFRFAENQLDLIYSTTGLRDEIYSLFPVSQSKIFFDAASTEINLFENGKTKAIPFKEFYQPDPGSQLPGNWYVGTRGAFYFHPQTGKASRFIHPSDQYAVWPSAILEDNNFLWMATHDGLIKLKPPVFTLHSVPAAAPYIDFYSVTELRNKTFLFGANAGRVFSRMDTSLGLFKDRLVPGAEVKDIYEDGNGRLWIASGYQGLALIRNGKTERYTIDNGLHDNSLHQFLTTRDNRFYVFGDEGLSQILIGKDQSVSFRKYNFQPNITRYAKFHSGIEGPDGTIWAGGEEGIIYLKNDSLHRFLLDGKQLSVNYIVKDKRGHVWLAAAGEGILECTFNKNNELAIINRYSEKEGLNTSNYLTLLADADDNIWAGSSKGISLIGKKGKYAGRILNFDESDGFIRAGYSYIRLRQASDKMIWAVTVFGIASFDPDQLTGTETTPFIYISGIRQIKKNETLTDNVATQFPQTKEFSYLDNSFNFNFAALDYANQENIRYYYKLEGLDTNWRNSSSQRSVSFQNLSPGRYTFRVKALNSKGTWSRNEAGYSFRIIPPFWKTWWFVSLLVVTIVSLFAFGINRRIRFIKNREVKNREKELEVMRLNKDLATSQLTALRMQMNPHFIFNALNSVQHYILQGNVVEANKYLAKFSKLQREILHCSDQQFITLEKEIEILNWFLELEQYRFGESFTYQINKSEEIEPDELKIPPMVLQPFVENAIWHGLMPRQTDRVLTIYFDLYSEDILQVTLRDNGIGRAASSRLKQNEAVNKKNHESRGMSMVQERLKLLQEQYDKPFDATVSDITDLQGNVQGTQVILRIFIGDKKS